jgi:hypothetical protein
MSGGLSQYTRTLNALQENTITVRGTFLMILEGPGSVEVSTRQYEIGSRAGTQYKNNLRRGEKIYAASEFDNVTIRNLAAAQATYTLLIGYGDFSREIPDRTGIADNLIGVTAEPTPSAAGQLIVAETPLARRVFLQCDSGNAGAIRIGGSQADVVDAGGNHNYLELWAAGSFTFETTAEIWGLGNGADIIRAIAETYNL